MQVWHNFIKASRFKRKTEGLISEIFFDNTSYMKMTQLLLGWLLFLKLGWRYFTISRKNRREVCEVIYFVIHNDLTNRNNAELVSKALMKNHFIEIFMTDLVTIESTPNREFLANKTLAELFRSELGISSFEQSKLPSFSLIRTTILRL